MLVRYTPRGFIPTLSLMDDMRRTFGMFFDGADPSLDGAWAGAPRFESTAKDDGLTLKAEVPGLEPEELDVSIDGDHLVVEAKSKSRAPEGYQTLRQERTVARWKQTLSLPYEVDADKVTAKLEDGILDLWLPKAERIKPKQIAVTG
jgi:HSP20 family protein